MLFRRRRNWYANQETRRDGNDKFNFCLENILQCMRLVINYMKADLFLFNHFNTKPIYKPLKCTYT